MKARLIRTTGLTPSVRQFTFEVVSAERHSFLPGQFVSLSARQNGIQLTRSYSIVSSKDFNQFELCLKFIPDGIFSRFLFALAPGAEIDMTAPAGHLVLRCVDRDAVMIAAGLGITPFRWMLRGHLGEMSGRATLLLGARNQEAILYWDEFLELQRRHSNFLFLPTLTRPTAAWQGRRGRVQAHIEEAVNGRSDLDIYLCGPQQMVDEVRLVLEAKGYDRNQIVYEELDRVASPACVNESGGQPENG
jgi:CDP-4-dehydro-6-deoxyglucose reductase, E3